MKKHWIALALVRVLVLSGCGGRKIDTLDGCSFRYNEGSNGGFR